MSHLGKFWGVCCLQHHVLPIIIFFSLLANCLGNTNVHVTRHWHLHQPIYWPEWNSNGSQTNRYQFGWDSLQLKIANANRYPGSPVRHPENNLVQGDPEGQYDAVFSPDDRINAYQGRPKSSLGKLLENPALPFAGYSMSYSGSLIENVNSFARNSAYGYSPSWNQNFIDMRNWRNLSGQRRHDLVGFTYHHSFGPLIPKSVLRKELEIFKEIYWKTWGGQPDKSDHSKGFWPAEAAFSRHMVGVLVDLGYEWSIVANSHLSRTIPNFQEVAGLGNKKSNIDPPNRADQLGPLVPPNQWWSDELDGRGAWQAAPFAYQAHKVKYVDPETGIEKKITVVPMDDMISYALGFGSIGTGSIDAKISPFVNDPSRPAIVLIATDGENAWGGGYDSWEKATPGFLREAHGKGYEATVIQKFLDDHPVPDSATVHIEDGAWVNAANDWGHPQFVNWLYPPVSLDAVKAGNPYTRFDFETPGFSEDFRNWAVLIAGANWMETAEQIYKGLNGPDSIQPWRIQEPYQANGTYNNPNIVERGWHIFLGGFDSGFMYYGDSLDDEVKQSLACNRAIAQIRSFVEGNLTSDLVGPSIFKPQRFPWNPGGKGWGPLLNYQAVGFGGKAPWSSEFYVWTHVYDVSDVVSVQLMVRVDQDGVNPVASNQNETFAGGSEVGTWVAIPMTKRPLSRGNPAGNPKLNFFISPDFMADYYFAKITDLQISGGIRNKLLDYYVEARDSRNNLSRSDIQHVYVEDDAGQGGGGGGGGSLTPSGPVVTLPSPPEAGQPLTITYNPTGRVLAGATNVNFHHGFNGSNWTTVPGVPMTRQGSNWVFTYNVPAQATNLTFLFNSLTNTNSNSGTWDKNNNADWVLLVTNPPTTAPAVPVGLTASPNGTNSISLSWSATPTATGYLLYRDDIQIAAPSGTSYLDTSLSPDVTYQYKLAASNGIGVSQPCLPVSAAPYFLPVANRSLRLVDPTNSINLKTNWFLFRGHAGLGLTNGLRWSNALNGSTGFISFTGITNPSGKAWQAALPVTNGTNRFTFISDYLPEPVELGRDAAIDSGYVSGWTNGSSGGAGFGPWVFSNSANAGFFRATQTNATNMDVVLVNGFGIFANSGGEARASRNLPSSMKPGDLLALRFDNNWIDNGGKVGVALLSSSGSSRLNFYFNGGDSNYRVDDAITNRDTSVAYTGSGFLVTVSLTGANSYSLSIGSTSVTGSLAATGDITRISVYNLNAGPNTERNFYIGEMTYTEFQAPQTAQITSADLIYNPITDGIADTWWAAYNIPMGQRVATNDYDGDGIVNLMEYGIGGNPTQAQTSPLSSLTWTNVSGTNYLKFVLRVRTNDAALKVEPVAKTNLTDGNIWSTSGAGQKVSGTPAGDGEHEDQVWLVPADGSERKFLRLKVSQ